MTSSTKGQALARDESKSTGLSGQGSAPEPAKSLVDSSTVIIEPRKNWVTLNLQELWAYRELLYFLTWRDVKVRYKQTALGVVWAVLQPLLMMIIFSVIFGRIAGIPSDGIPYPLFAYGGLLAWTFFSTATTNSGNSLVGNANLITKVYFPRIIIPGAALCAATVDLIFGFVFLLPLMVYYRVLPTWHIVMLPVLTIILMILALGVGLWMSALNVKYRDVRFALPYLMQIWMFLTPLIYPLSGLSPSLKVVFMFNPVTGIIEGFRSALFGLPFNWPAISVSLAITLLTFLFALMSFKRMERQFADVV